MLSTIILGVVLNAFAADAPANKAATKTAPSSKLTFTCPPKIKGEIPDREGWRVESAKTDLSEELTATVIELIDQQVFHCFYKRPGHAGAHQLELVRETKPGYRKCTRVNSTSFECVKS